MDLQEKKAVATDMNIMISQKQAELKKDVEAYQGLMNEIIEESKQAEE